MCECMPQTNNGMILLLSIEAKCAAYQKARQPWMLESVWRLNKRCWRVFCVTSCVAYSWWTSCKVCYRRNMTACDDIGYMVAGLRNCDSRCSASQWSSPQKCIIETKAISLLWTHANILNKGIACSYSQDTESIKWSSYGQLAPLWVETLIIKSHHATVDNIP